MSSAGKPTDTSEFAPAVMAWLAARRAVWARMGSDGVLEFSTRPIGDALTDAVRGLLPATK